MALKGAGEPLPMQLLHGRASVVKSTSTSGSVCGRTNNGAMQQRREQHAATHYQRSTVNTRHTLHRRCTHKLGVAAGAVEAAKCHGRMLHVQHLHHSGSKVRQQHDTIVAAPHLTSATGSEVRKPVSQQQAQHMGTSAQQRHHPPSRLGLAGTW